MSYTLQAIISDLSLIGKAVERKIPCVRLSDTLSMIPLAHEFIEDKGMPFLPLTDEGEQRIDGELRELCMELSKDSMIAYVEAEYFGGEGTQGCWVLKDGKEEIEASTSGSAINLALRQLGVSRVSNFDEFASVGLGRHRDTSEWIEHEVYRSTAGNAEKQPKGSGTAERS